MSWLGREIVRLGAVASTNDEAMARARAGAAHGTVVVADTQTAGRGRQGRSWFSPPGDNLYVSAILRLPLPPAAAPPITLAAGVAVCDTARLWGAAANLKWPNDVQVDSRKLAGILTETATRGDKLDVIVLGIGLNVNTRDFPGELAEIATSLRRCRGGEALDRDEVLVTLLGEVERWVDRFAAGGAVPVVRAWKERAATIGQRLRVVVEGRTLDGVARDVDDEGALWLVDDNGKQWRVLSGDAVPITGGGPGAGTDGGPGPRTGEGT